LTTVQSASKATSPTTWSGSCPAGEWPHLLLLIGWLCVAGGAPRPRPAGPVTMLPLPTSQTHLFRYPWTLKGLCQLKSAAFFWPFLHQRKRLTSTSRDWTWCSGSRCAFAWTALWCSHSVPTFPAGIFIEITNPFKYFVNDHEELSNQNVAGVSKKRKAISIPVTFYYRKTMWHSLPQIKFWGLGENGRV
jgi:hypothetical protein